VKAKGGQASSGTIARASQTPNPAKADEKGGKSAL
jgi:hypothetical protein